MTQTAPPPSTAAVAASKPKVAATGAAAGALPQQAAAAAVPSTADADARTKNIRALLEQLAKPEVSAKKIGAGTLSHHLTTPAARADWLYYADAGVIQPLVDCLRLPGQNEIHFYAASGLTNMAAYGTGNTIDKIIEAGAVPLLLLRVAEASDPELVHQCLWALGNIAGDSAVGRDNILKAENNAVQIIKAAMSKGRNPTPKVLRMASWLFCNLCRGRPAPNRALTKHIVPILAQMLKRRNKWVQKNACWGLAFLAEGAEEWVDELLQHRALLPKLVELLGHTRASIVAAALRTIGQILMGDETRVKLVIDCGALPALKQLLQHKFKSIRKDACWCISNITVDSAQHIQAVIDADIMPIIVDMLKQKEGDFEIRKECAWVCCNVSCGGQADQIALLADLGVSPPLFDLLDTSKDKKLVTIVLEGLENILYEDAAYSDNITEEQVEKLRKLANADDETTREVATCLLDSFF